MDRQNGKELTPLNCGSAYKEVVLEKTPEKVPWLARRSNQSILRDINPEYSLEGLMLKLKLQYFGHDAKNRLIGKGSDAGKD